MLDTTINMVALGIVSDLPVMELANEYPPLLDDQETDLIASVEANGIREPLVIFRSVTDADDQLLDGRNRLASATKVGLDVVPVRYFTGTIEEAEDLIIDLNEKRRHLLPVQRAFIAEKHTAIIARRAKERMAAAGASAAPGRPAEKGSTSLVLPLDEPLETGRTSTIAAKKHNAGRQSVETVQKIRRVSEETMDDPDSDGVVMTPRAIRASGVLTKMQKGTITVSDAVKNVFGEPGQDINPDDQTKIASAKHALGKIVTELNTFDVHASVLMELGNDADQAFVWQKASRVTSASTAINQKFGRADDEELDNLLDPEENRDYWSEVESENRN